MSIPQLDIGALYEQFLRCGRVSTDSRGDMAGAMFFALKGESFDGNRFAVQALERGAVHAVVDDPDTVCLAGAHLSGRITVVSDSLAALQQLAAHHRRQLAIPVLAITGTNGKTTTKELVSRVLSYKYMVSATKGNLNNHIGVPLTLLGMDSGVEFGVVEMGASGPGEIALLCGIARPDYGLITNIGMAHLEGFGGPDGVRSAKGELYDFLAVNGGLAFVRRGDQVLMAMAAERPSMRMSAYGDSEGELPNRLEGSYNRMNIASAVAVGSYFGVEQGDIRRAVAEYTPDNNRSQAVTTGHNKLLVDCYNANPSSMREALANFAALAPEPGYGDKAAILGDMFELGEWSCRQHAEILAFALAAGLKAIYLVGDNFGRAATSALRQGNVAMRCFGDSGELARYFRENPVSGYHIIIKGSRATRLEEVISAL